ncbi:nuclear transport factor 2 family protein [Budvicia aquatica]|uniref:Nuclear transport factor 2 family protein n=1 Tax=Budvicia aquatica TaxID=82979 RepID=A0A2C6C0Y2_9GAMM|nr:nuclear transport factor 2 family protein [Budvicia aquatica]PHI30010.1 nuclear transport factor 2 family protein [Budvicia aquatica]VFS48913.1 Uncharacterised protein [Budvicia aquatica]
MSSFKSDLNLMRQEWYNAFYTGNIEQLDYLETDWFLATNGQKFLYKKHQLRKISLGFSTKSSLCSNVIRKEYDVIISEFKGIACVSGKALITETNSVTNVNFIENWIKINGGWKLQFQSFEAI